jgi:hypothetical protein
LLRELVTNDIDFGATVEIRVRFDVVSHGDRDVQSSSSFDLF